MKPIKDLYHKVKNAFKSDQETDEKKQEIKEKAKLKSWYQERYDTILVQRNFLFFLLLLLVLLSIISVAVVAYTVNAKRFDPFVIQIDDTTGAAQIVNPESSNIIAGNDALAQYFIKKYVIARETYNPVDFEKEARNLVRLYSTSRIYWAYRGYLRNEKVNPLIIYGQKNTTFLKLKSWSKLADNKFIMRFSINETGGSRRTFHKIAVVEFDYIAMELTEKEKEINPVGFIVTDYRVDDDNS